LKFFEQPVARIAEFTQVGSKGDQIQIPVFFANYFVQFGGGQSGRGRVQEALANAVPNGSFFPVLFRWAAKRLIAFDTQRKFLPLEYLKALLVANDFIHRRCEPPFCGGNLHLDLMKFIDAFLFHERQYAGRLDTGKIVQHLKTPISGAKKLNFSMIKDAKIDKKANLRIVAQAQRATIRMHTDYFKIIFFSEISLQRAVDENLKVILVSLSSGSLRLPEF
jgi:hypothetical protein